MRILVDMDGITADMFGKWIPLYNAEFDDCLSVDMIDCWYLRDCTKPECDQDKIIRMLQEPGFFDDLKPLAGAIEGIKELVAIGHDVRFATAPCGPDSARAKMAWLDYHFFGSGITGRDSFICQDKDWIEADLLIDDKPETLESWQAKGCLTATIEYPYNAHLAVDCMASSCMDTETAWAQIVAFVKRMENVVPLRRTGR